MTHSMNNYQNNKEAKLQEELRSAAIDMVIVIEALLSEVDYIHQNAAFHDIIQNLPYLQERIGSLVHSMLTTGAMGVSQVQIQAQEQNAEFHNNLVRLRELIRDLIQEHQRINQDTAAGTYTVPIPTAAGPLNATFHQEDMTTNATHVTLEVSTPGPSTEIAQPSSTQSKSSSQMVKTKKAKKRRSITAEECQQMIKKKTKQPKKK